MPAATDDVVEITQLLYRYARAIDAKDWKALEGIFTPDARIHYAVERGAELRFPELGPWLAKAMTIFKATQHVITNPLVEINGDSARRLERTWLDGHYLGPDEARHFPSP